MIPFQSHAVSGVALSRFDGQYKILMMKRTKGNYWCHVAGGIEEGEAGCKPSFESLPKRPK